MLQNGRALCEGKWIPPMAPSGPGTTFCAAVWSATLLLAACTTPPTQPSLDAPSANKQAAEEVRRICALPASARQAEIDRVQKKYGLVVDCPDR